MKRQNWSRSTSAMLFNFSSLDTSTSKFMFIHTLLSPRVLIYIHVPNTYTTNTYIWGEGRGLTYINKLFNHKPALSHVWSERLFINVSKIKLSGSLEVSIHCNRNRRKLNEDENWESWELSIWIRFLNVNKEALAFHLDS